MSEEVSEEDKKLANWIIRNHDQLKSVRGTWENHWQEIADFVVPAEDQITQKTTAGEKKGTQLFNTTAIHANEMLASGLHSMLTNPSVKWFDLFTGNKEIDSREDVKAWVQDSVRKMHNVLNFSNFQTIIHEIYLDLGSFGTAMLVIDEDQKYVVRFSSRPIVNALISADNKARIQTVYRTFEFTGMQMLQEYGQDIFSEQEKRDFKENPMEKHSVIHAVFPNDDFNPFQKSLSSKPFNSIHVFKKGLKPVRKGGFEEFPYAVPRWTKHTHEMYGRSPAMKSLPDIKLINEVNKVSIVAAQKAIDPPLQAPDDGVVLPLRTAPGSINYYRSGTKDRIEPLFTGSDPRLGFEFMEQIKLSIRQAFFVDQLQLNEGPQMTATEVLQRTEEKLRMLGPVLGRLHNELLKPLVDRVFGIMLRRGIFLDAPEILEDRDLQVRYSSMIARAQKATEIDNFNRALGAVGPLIQLDPNIIDNIDMDGTFKYIVDTLDVPVEILASEQQKKQTREAKAQVAQQQQANEQEAHDAETVNKVQQ